MKRITACLLAWPALSLFAPAAQADLPYAVPMMAGNPAYPFAFAPLPYAYPAPMPQMPAPAMAWPLPVYPMPTAQPIFPAAPAPAMPAAAPVAPAVPAQVPATPVPITVAPVAHPADNPWLQAIQPTSGFLPFAAMLTPGPREPLKPYAMRRIISGQEKAQMMQMMLPMMTGFMRMDMAEAMNYFARKVKAKPGLSFDDVRDSLFLRANQLNMKKVGENLMWKDFQVVLEDKTAPRIEVYSFCDIAVGRDLLKISPEMIVFLPCRIAIMEDADKNIWILTIDWEMDWIKGFEKQLGLSDELIKGAISIGSRMNEMIQAAANGDL